jgi:IS30 family transposase
MSEKYHRLCVEDRKVIHDMNKGGFGQAEIGQSIGFGQSAVSKELSRNKGKRGYRSKQADDLAKQRSDSKNPHLDIP